ncbi:MAG: nucleotide-binding protein [Armatimonadota bacterium]
MSVPRIIVGGIRNGEGKTTVALGLMAALRQRGLAVQGYKVGPDYLDTGYQWLATGRPGRNIDLWMMGEAAVRESVIRHGETADLCVI